MHEYTMGIRKESVGLKPDPGHVHVPKLLIAIVDREKADELAEMVNDAHVFIHYRSRAKGTARSEMLDMLGLGRTDKSITYCIGPGHSLDELLQEISVGLRLKKHGHGIAFTVPISGISNPIFKILDESLREHLKSHIEREVEKMKSESAYELIMAVINRGYSDDLMNAAREAGARGGTVVNARRMGEKETLKAWGISVQEEKEIVYIVARKEDKVNIMKAIGKSCGLNCSAQGFVLSLPVDSLEGVNSGEV